VALVNGRHNDLLSFEVARKALRASQQLPETTEMIPLDKIVGSVGRYHDFTRAFSPRQGVDRARWARLDAALARLETIPPIEVYQLGDVYFVRDGNHRVSVARANGLVEIEARVTRLESRVPFTSDVESGMEVIREYTAFLEQTNLDYLCPQQRIFFSTQGQYRVLLEHIAVHRYFMGLDLQCPVSYEEALVDWYDTLYEPVVQAIRREHILDDFPGRTEADLYLWIMDHHYYLSERYGKAISPGQAAELFAAQHGGGVVERAVRAVRREVQDVAENLAGAMGLGRAPHTSDEGPADRTTGEESPNP
jgi:hypothetical protein